MVFEIQREAQVVTLYRKQKPVAVNVVLFYGFSLSLVSLSRIECLVSV